MLRRQIGRFQRDSLLYRNFSRRDDSLLLIKRHLRRWWKKFFEPSPPLPRPPKEGKVRGLFTLTPPLPITILAAVVSAVNH